MKRVQADNSEMSTLYKFWLCFIIILTMMFISSFFTPESFVIKTNSTQFQSTTTTACTNPVEFYNQMLICKDFNVDNPKLGLLMRKVSPLNQFAYIQLLVIPKNQDYSTTIKIDQLLKVELFSLKTKEISSNQNSNSKKLITFTKADVISTIDDLQFKSEEHELISLNLNGSNSNKNEKNNKSDKNGSTAVSGYEITIGYFHDFHHEDYLLVLTFKNITASYLEQFNFVLEALMINHNYTKFILIMRYVFASISLLTTAAYLLFCKTSYKIKSCFVLGSHKLLAEQKYVMILSVCLFLFNDPLYALTVYVPNTVNLILSILMTGQFIVVLLLIWVLFLQKINQSSMGMPKISQFEGIGPTKKIIFTIMFLVSFIVICAFNIDVAYYTYTQKPIIPSHLDFQILYICSVVLFIIVFLYILYLYFKIYSKWNCLIWRDKLFILFTMYFIVLLLVFSFGGWFNLYDESSQQFEILYASMNLYVIYLQYMYSPAWSKAFKADRISQEDQQNTEEDQEDSHQKSTVVSFNNNQIIDIYLNDQEDANKVTKHFIEETKQLHDTWMEKESKNQ